MRSFSAVIHYMKYCKNKYGLDETRTVLELSTYLGTYLPRVIYIKKKTRGKIKFYIYLQVDIII